MHRVARQTGRLALAPRAVQPPLCHAAPVFLQTRHKTDWIEKSWRRFWGKSEEKDTSQEAKTTSTSNAVTAEEAISERPNSQIVSTYGDDAPRTSPIVILPVMRHPIFPGFMGHHLIKDEKVIDALLAAQKNADGYVGLFLRKLDGDGLAPPQSEIEHYGEKILDISHLHSVGVFAQVRQVNLVATGAQLFITGMRRVTLESVEQYGPPTIAKVNHWKTQRMIPLTKSVKAYTNELLYASRELLKINPTTHGQLGEWVFHTDYVSDPYKFADFATSLTTANPAEKQLVLDAEDVELRLMLALDLVNKEKEVAYMQKKISAEVEKSVTKSQREYMLREQIKTINKELGIEQDGKEELVKGFRAKVDTAKPHIAAATVKVMESELSKLSSLEKNSPEYAVSRHYLEWLTSIPWGRYTTDQLNITKATEILEEDHFGLSDVKKRILEFIAVGRLKGRLEGNILCLVGPPGVGKTSIAKSIASSLNREFYRFSVGGLTDISEIKGHRRTYIGAMPGKPILCMKSTGSMNPLILIDEIDKVGKGYQGDPGSALLELLDPNQNSSFVDHYLDVPVDFSGALFVCTANDEGSIPGPLRDRMDIIRIAGYDIPEKVAIAKKYLVPKAMKHAGLDLIENLKMDITDSAINILVKQYCRESGVRNLERHIDMLTRKLAFKVVVDSEKDNENSSENVVEANNNVQAADTLSHAPESEKSDTDTSATAESSADVSEKRPIVDATILSSIRGPAKPVVVDADNIADFVGQPRYTESMIYDSANMPVGVVMGLGWNPLGGSPIFIEAVGVPVGGGAETKSGVRSVHMVTGQLGTVMKESVNIAYSFVNQLISKISPDNTYLRSHQVHVHCPEGAVEKDGPSAGIGMATALISLAMKVPVRQHLAMTGEISLTGKVLPVGGIKEKILAAKRSGAKTIILPFDCTKDHAELPEYVKEDLTFVFAREYSEVFDVAFPNVDRTAAKN